MMQYRLFSLLVLLFAGNLISSVSAQTQKHHLMIGGNGSYSKQFYDNIDPVTNGFVGTVRRSMNINPTQAYFVVDNLALGLSLNLNNTQSSITESKEKLMNSNAYAVGPIVRYYFPRGKWAIFPEVQALKISGKQHSYQHLPATRLHDGSLIKAGIGMSYFILPTVGIEGLLSYTAERITYNTDPPTTYYNLSDFTSKRDMINLQIGIQFYLGLKKSGKNP